MTDRPSPPDLPAMPVLPDPDAAPNRLPLYAALGAAALVGVTVLLSGSRHAHAAPVAHAASAAALPAGVVVLSAAQRADVQVAVAATRAERVAAVVPAQLALDEDRTARVFSPVAGRVVRILASPGDRVRAGQPLAELVSADVAQAGADLAKADAQARETDAALARARDLYAHRVVALRDLQQAQADAAAASAERGRAAARARVLGTGAGGGQAFVLRAPVAGEVIDRQVNPGSEVQPGTVGAGAPLFTVSDLADVWLTANLYQRDLAGVRPGARVTFRAEGAEPVEARVRWVGDALDPQTRTAPMRAVVPNVAPGGTRGLRAGEFGEATVWAPDVSGAPVVPSVALVTHGGETVVYVEEAPGRFRRRAVTVGDDDGRAAGIARGLRAGERVAAAGALLLDAEAERQATTAAAARGAGGGA